MGTLLVSFSQAVAPSNDSTNSKVPVPKDRNMFGHGIPRGVTVSTEGLAEGYVMFAVPTSGSIYLINRKGEVVHEWKGNYGGMATSAYLGNDGSITQNAVDPDFPVFAGGGEAGEQRQERQAGGYDRTHKRSLVTGKARRWCGPGVAAGPGRSNDSPDRA